MISRDTYAKFIKNNNNMEEITKNLKEYTIGYILQEDEYLFKLRDDGVGFLAKLTQKNEIPKDFLNWTKSYSQQICGLKTYIFNNCPYEGWELVKWRFGMSQNWAKVKHPLGFIVEVQLSNLLQTLLSTTMINGKISGSFKWSKHNGLIK